MNCITGPAIFSSKTITWGREGLVCDSSRGLSWSQIGEGIENQKEQGPTTHQHQGGIQKGLAKPSAPSPTLTNLNRLRLSPPGKYYDTGEGWGREEAASAPTWLMPWSNQAPGR